MKFVLCTLIILFTINYGAYSREKQLINFGWKFSLGDFAEASKLNFDDSDWEVVNLPHDASIYGEFVKDTLGGNRRNGYRPRHIGWYRKHLIISKIQSEKRYVLEFEGVYRASDVWVNGVHCGVFLNGYLDFEYDITSLIRPGENIVAVRFDNTYKESSRWYTGEGITRDVYLNVVGELHIDRYGTYVSTPKIEKQQAKVSIETNVFNQSVDSVICKLITLIVSPDGNTVANGIAVVPFAAGETYCFNQEVKVKDPVLWNIDQPRLYKAVSMVYNNGKLVDINETKFGIRKIEFTADHGFLLNGKKIFLKGVCLHHDLGPLGAASFASAWNKRLSILKNEMGCNAIRLSHNPYPQYVLNWCDENGLLVFDEAFDKWSEQYYGPGEKFEDHWSADLGTFIKRDRNHPSVFIWSLGNEVVAQQIENIEQGVTFLKKMSAFVKQMDPTRKITFALYPARHNGVKYNDPAYSTSEPNQMAFYVDVMSSNYQSEFFYKDHKKYPQLVFLTSEMATNDAGYGYFDYDHSYTCGQFYWGGTEYIGESIGWPSKGWINGAIDLTNKLKSSGYSIKSFYNEEPMVKIAIVDNKKAGSKIWNDARISWKPKYFHWNWTKGEKLTVQTFTNCDSVELFVNGRSQGIKSLFGKKEPELLWNVDYQPGIIEANGYKNGNLICKNKLQTAGKAYRIVLESDRDTIHSDGVDLAYISVKIVDKNGILVPLAANRIEFSVTGDGSNAGVGNGDINSDELWQANIRSVYEGECQLIIRSTRIDGQVKIKACTPGLKSSKLILVTSNGPV